MQSVTLSTQKRGIIALPAFEVCINVIFFHANRTIENNALDAFYFLVDPLVGSIATQYVNDREEHDRIAKEWTRRFAT